MRPGWIIRRVVLGLVLSLAVLAAVLLVRTLTWHSPQIRVTPAELVALDEPGAIRRLSASLRLETVSRPAPATPAVEPIQAFHRLLEASFPRVHATLRREVLGGLSLLYTWEGTDHSAQPILLMAHLDVVPIEPGTESHWTHGPFSGDVAAGYIWGRGALDMKAGLMGQLEAVEALLARGFRPRRTVLLAFGHDEELGGMHGAAAIAAQLRSQKARLALVLDEGGVITRGMVPGLDPPVALVGLAEKGYLSVELSAEATGGHSSMPPPQTAVGIIAAGVHALEAHPMPAGIDGAAALMFDRLGPEMPFGLRLAFANRWLFDPLILSQMARKRPTNAVIRTTTAATMISGGVKENILPARARAVVNFRLKPGDSAAAVLDHVRTAVADRRVTVNVLPGGREASPMSDAAAPGILAVERSVRRTRPGTLVAPALTVTGGDSHHYRDLADAIGRFLPYTLGPGDAERIHGTDERIGVEDYLGCIRFYLELLRELADDRGSDG